MWGGRTHNSGLWLMVEGWQLTEWCCCSDTPGCGEDQTAGPEDAVLQRYLCGDWHPQAVLGWGWQQWGRRVPWVPLSQFRAGWKLGVLQGTAPSSSPRCWCLCCVTTPHLLANPPPGSAWPHAGCRDTGQRSHEGGASPVPSLSLSLLYFSVVGAIGAPGLTACHM